MDCIKKVLDSSTELKGLTKDIKDLLGAVETVGVVEQEIAAHKGNNKVAEQIRITRGSNTDMAVLRELVEGKGVQDTAFSYKDAGIGMLSDKLKSTLARTLDSVKSVLGNIGEVEMSNERITDMVKAFMARDNVQVAVAATIEDYVASSLNELAKPIDYYEFIEDMGLRNVLASGTPSQRDEWTKSIRQSAAKGGKSAAFVADELGKQLLVNLGVPTSKLVDEVAYKNLVTKLGGNMLQMMVARGLIEPLGDIRGNNPNGFMPTPWTVAKVEGNKMGYAWVRPTQAAKNGMKSITDNARAAQQLLEDELGMTIDKREPTFRKPKEEITKVRRQPFSVAKPHLQEAVNNFQQVGWTIHDKAVGLLEQLYTTPEELAVAMGRPELNTSEVVVGKNGEVSEVVLHSRDEAESIRAQQSAIDDTIKYFKDFVAKVNNQEAKKFYFKWFIARNERAMIDSNTVNPQNDKQLARWLMIPDDYKYAVSRIIRNVNKWNPYKHRQNLFS